jgi:peptidyl-prolyl cis-trans isomerase C
MSSIIRNFLVFNIIFILSTAKLLAKDLNKIIAAKVNNHIISAQDVLNAVNTLPENVKTKPLSEIYPRIINELINKHLITKRAYNEKLDLDQNVLNLIQKNKDSILAKYWLNNYIKNETSEENIKNFYNEYVKSFKEYTEVNASHILVKTKKEAVSIINKLKSKSQFSELAKTFSIGPSGENGGNLGWFGPGQMVKEFEKAAFLIEKGNISQKPIKTKFGFHVIKVNDIRNAKPKKLYEIKKNIIEKITKVSLSNLENKIRKNQDVVIVKFKDVVKEVNK